MFFYGHVLNTAFPKGRQDFEIAGLLAAHFLPPLYGFLIFVIWKKPTFDKHAHLQQSDFATPYIFSHLLAFPNCHFSHEKTWKKKPALLVQASLVPALALQGRPAPVHPAHPAAGRCQGAGRGSLAVLESWIFRVFFVKSKLLGGWATPLKNLKVSWIMTFPTVSGKS